MALGSHDENPEQVEIPGLKDKALSPQQKRALQALRRLDVLREKRKESNKALKIEEDEALEEALAALDGLGLQVGKIGPAMFEASVVRKLKLKIAKRALKEGEAP